MNEYYLNCSQLKEISEKLNVGDKVYLSGCLYTARDAAHKRIDESLNRGASLPFELENSVIYYAGPTPTPVGMAIGSCGPTTSSRMDKFAPRLYDLGVAATIGKGMRSKEVVDSIIKNRALYLCAIGGAGALAALCIKKCEVIDFEDLGCESVKKLEFDNFPLIVAIDSKGNNIFK
ncbi:MAG: fumarate hydratase C-terminal domain-containing protein [Clostridia bacterium]|nr:fumarate hydratase C-terminal domain-containing protein [Clostridia bacterium]